MPFGGTMAVTSNAAVNKPIIRRRQFLQAVAVRNESEQTLSATQSFAPVGSQFTANTLLFQMKEFGQNAVGWVQTHDLYKIEKIEVFATLEQSSTSDGYDNFQTGPVIHYCYEDIDADPATQTSWIRLQDRSNLCRVVLRANNPSVKIAELNPTPTFAASSGETQSPANMIPTKGAWLDAVAIEQFYAGLRCFSACPKVDSSGQTYRYSITYEVRAHVAAKQPI